MRVAVYNGAHDVVVEDWPMPEVGTHDVLVRNLYAGVCGSDVAVYEHGPAGHQVKEGDEFGHEVISEVAAVGADVADFSVGDRVYPYPLLARGGPHRAGYIGGFSEYMLVENAREDLELFRVSEDIPLNVAALIEPFTVAHNGVRAGRPQPGENAVVFGAGTIGIGAAVALKSFGVAQVLVVDLSELRLQKAAQLGFATAHGGRDDVGRRAAELFGEVTSLMGTSVDVDVFVDAAGADPLIATYQSIAKAGSRLVVVGVHYRPVPVDLQKLTFGAQSIIGAGGYQPGDVRDVLRILASGEWDLETIITHTFPLERITEAIETAGDRDNALHVVVSHLG